MPYIHFGENSDIVEIKNSKIANAGQGLFAKKRIKKGDFICWYFGVLVEKDFVDNEYYDSDYLLKNPFNNLIIDASDPNSCFGRYINDGLGEFSSNSKFDFYEDTTSGAVIATKNIKKGDEIFISYGMTYWNEPRRYNLLSQRNKEYLANRDTAIEL